MADGPEAKFQDGGVQAAVWKNENGYSISLQKSYKDKKTNQWVRMKISFFPPQIEQAIGVLQQAKDFVEKNGMRADSETIFLRKME